MSFIFYYKYIYIFPSFADVCAHSESLTKRGKKSTRSLGCMGLSRLTQCAFKFLYHCVELPSSLTLADGHHPFWIDSHNGRPCLLTQATPPLQNADHVTHHRRNQIYYSTSAESVQMAELVER